MTLTKGYCIIVRIGYMNLHEECLINYLSKPDELAYTTEILKLSNKLMERELVKTLFSGKIKIEVIKS